MDDGFHLSALSVGLPLWLIQLAGIEDPKSVDPGDRIRCHRSVSGDLWDDFVLAGRVALGAANPRLFDLHHWPDLEHFCGLE